MSRGALSKLYYDSVLVGDVAEPFEHQGTWFGTFTSHLPPAGSETQLRLAEFIAFCERWHERLKAGDDPDAREFDAFGPILKSGNWRVEDERGERMAIEQAPVFVEGEVSWVCPESRPPGGVT
jgi:hypothetical protein